MQSYNIVIVIKQYEIEVWDMFASMQPNTKKIQLHWHKIAIVAIVLFSEVKANTKHYLYYIIS
jgi:hypothetical protein